MESVNRSERTDLKWLWFLLTALGTVLLAFAPSGAWLTASTEAPLFAYGVKQAATVLLLLIVPSLWARSAHCVSAWTLFLLAAIAYGCGFWITKDAIEALYTLLLIALPGAGLFALQKAKLSNFRAVLYLSVLLLIALFGYVCLNDLIKNGDAYLPFRRVISAYEQALHETEQLLGVGEEPSLLADVFSEYRLKANEIGVPILLLPSMAAGLSNVLFSHLFNRRGGAELRVLPPFSEWRCERPFVIAVTLFMIAATLLQMSGWNGTAALAGVGSMLWRFPCALAGLSAARRLSLRAKKGWIFAIVCVGAAVIPVAGLPMLALLGMLASLRKRTDVGEDGTRK